MRAPKNKFTGTEYQGKNADSLAMQAALHKYESDDWATYKQWLEGGYQVQKGEHGTGIQVVREHEDKPDKKVVKYYKVFNKSQVKQIEEDK